MIRGNKSATYDLFGRLLLLGYYLPSSSSFLPASGKEKRRSEFIDSKGFDDVLGFFRDHEISKSLCPCVIDLGPFCRIHLNDMIDIEKDGIPFDQNIESRFFFNARYVPRSARV